jgi:pimeloyl-ACP methyl ester carboxylesterase
VAIKTAHRHPERARNLVLINSVGGSTWESGSRLRAISELRLTLSKTGDQWRVAQVLG